MASYSARLFKKTTGTTKMFFEEVHRIDFDATDDNDARAKAPHLQIPIFDDSDLAIVLDHFGRVVWRLEP